MRSEVCYGLGSDTGNFSGKRKQKQAEAWSLVLPEKMKVSFCEGFPVIRTQRVRILLDFAQI